MQLWIVWESAKFVSEKPRKLVESTNALCGSPLCRMNVKKFWIFQMIVPSSASTPKKDNLWILFNKTFFTWFLRVTKSLNTVLERILNCFYSSMSRDLSISNQKFGFLYAISCLQSQYKAGKNFPLLAIMSFLLFSLFQ